eukprot:scaffold48_cov311-Pinguiococcus_pyrenoidosus.AAC.179
MATKNTGRLPYSRFLACFTGTSRSAVSVAQRASSPSASRGYTLQRTEETANALHYDVTIVSFREYSGGEAMDPLPHERALLQDAFSALQASTHSSPSSAVRTSSVALSSSSSGASFP